MSKWKIQTYKSNEAERRVDLESMRHRKQFIATRAMKQVRKSQATAEADKIMQILHDLPVSGFMIFCLDFVLIRGFLSPLPPYEFLL